MRDKGLDVTFVRHDVADESSWRTLMDTVKAERGRLDVLVNNAGIIHVTPIVDEDLSAWTHLLGVNLTGAFLGIRAAIPLMAATGGGSIVNTSSIFGPAGAVGYSAYAASKAGLLASPALLHWNWHRRTFVSMPCVPVESARR